MLPASRKDLTGAMLECAACLRRRACRVSGLRATKKPGYPGFFVGAEEELLLHRVLGGTGSFGGISGAFGGIGSTFGSINRHFGRIGSAGSRRGGTSSGCGCTGGRSSGSSRSRSHGTVFLHFILRCVCRLGGVRSGGRCRSRSRSRSRRSSGRSRGRSRFRFFFAASGNGGGYQSGQEERFFHEGSLCN